MTSGSNSNNKAEKKCLELKPLYKLNYSSLGTGCDPCLQRLSYKSTEKLFKKVTKLKNPNVFEKK